MKSEDQLRNTGIPSSQSVEPVSELKMTVLFDRKWGHLSVNSCGSSPISYPMKGQLWIMDMESGVINFQNFWLCIQSIYGKIHAVSKSQYC